MNCLDKAILALNLIDYKDIDRQIAQALININVFCSDECETSHTLTLHNNRRSRYALPSHDCKYVYNRIIIHKGHKCAYNRTKDMLINMDGCESCGWKFYNNCNITDVIISNGIKQHSIKDITSMLNESVCDQCKDDFNPYYIYDNTVFLFTCKYYNTRGYELENTYLVGEFKCNDSCTWGYDVNATKEEYYYTSASSDELVVSRDISPSRSQSPSPVRHRA